MRQGGYATAAFTEDGWVSAEMGFARGFGSFALDGFSDLDAQWFSPRGDQVARFHITDFTINSLDAGTF